MLRTQKILSTSHIALECYGVLLLCGILSIYHFMFLSHIHTLSAVSFVLSRSLSLLCRLLFLGLSL